MFSYHPHSFATCILKFVKLQANVCLTLNAGILHGAWLMLATGLGMIGILQLPGSDEQVNNLVLVAKSIVITAVFFVAYTYNKKEKTPTWVVPAIAGLTTLNIVFAVVWGIVS